LTNRSFADNLIISMITDKQIESASVKTNDSESENRLVILLQEYIAAEKLEKGDKLPSIMTFEKLWGFNPSQIRTGLLKASMLGIINIKPRSGSYVGKIEASDFIYNINLVYRLIINNEKSNLFDLYDLKYCIEGEACRIACRFRTDKEHYQLKKIIEAMGSVDDTKQMVQLDEEFHRLITDITKNNMFIIQVAAIHQILHAPRIANSHYKDNYEKYHKDHIDLFNAIKEQDEEEAVKIAYLHHNRNKEKWMEIHSVI
jgi:DNA-binding FadR family transcriptional regulator